MPPPESLKARVLFFYLDDDLVGRDIRGPETYWKAVGKQYYENDDNFIGNRKEIQRVAQETVGSNDPPEAKLAKLYARAQQIRNTSFERSKTEKEQKKEKIKENMNAGEVLKHGYGGGSDINLFFTALARAAGFEATIAYLTARRDGYFEPNMLSDSQFDASIVQVRQGNQTWHLDPATKFCPFNLLPWEETWSRGILPNKDGYTNITTPEPKVADAVIERKAAFRLDEEGTLGGAVRIVFIGQEALDRRLGNRDQDEKGRRKAAEDEVKGWLPAGAAVELTNSPAWEQSDNQLEAEFKVTIPQYATATGRRILLPLSVFQAKEKYPFRATRRVHPIYLDHPFQQQDEVTAELPPGFEVETLPAPRNKEFPALRYEIARTHQARTLKLTRTLAVQKHMFDVQSYSALRVFYDNVRAGDEEQIVLKAVDSEPPK